MSDDISAGVASLGREDDSTADTYNLIGELKDPLPGVKLSRAKLDTSGAASKTEKSRAGMITIAPLAFKIQSDSSNTEIDKLRSDFTAGTIKKWEYKYATDGGTVETQVFEAWIGDLETTPNLKDGTFIMITLNPNTMDKS
ncbi:MAG: hypothetical protein V7785_22010 [Bermanella sp.]